MKSHVMKSRPRSFRVPVVEICALLIVAGFLASPATAQVPTVINVEIDYMVGGTHSHQPSQAEINAIVQMFACHGITLNVVVDDQITHIATMVDGSNPDDFFSATGSNTFQSIKSANFDNTGGGWHYCVFGHDYQEDLGPTNSSGLAETGGDDLVVTLGSFTDQIGTPFDRAATFAHELGHNLGLRHFGQSGPASADSIGNFQPNYASIMSYQYQLNGLRTQLICLGLADETSLFKEIDYSDGRLPTADENALNEQRGLGIVRVDWDCDDVFDAGAVAKDLDIPFSFTRWCNVNGPREILEDYNDWANIVDNSLVVQSPAHEYETCVTADETQAYRLRTLAPDDCNAAQPTLTTESCSGGRMLWVDSGYSGPETGIGDQPYNTLLDGYNAAPSASTLYLQPGSYHVGTTVLTKRLILSGPGSATISP